ncbi:uncharacterized protein LOC111643256 [Copidosoma floridanum]|uniref:uncharacterized protein LOC111643256 n=1 Tax=Copidosoma floridanum TaxID=29053 RepID=UPI000C6FAC74|nr:uncharacterized protein LOC111643256 [Copidosoma floridanum]
MAGGMASSADALLARQENLRNAIGNSLANLTKLGTANYSNAVITVRMNSLDTNWKEFKNNYLTLLTLQENLIEQDYIKNDVYAKTKEFYLTALATMLSLLETYSAPILPTAASSSQAPSAPTSSSRKLPEIKLPTFTGDYKLWPEFRDLFISGVSSSSLLNNVEKLFYLKSSLAGDAAELVRGISLEGDNFQRTWDALKDAFEVPRVQVDALLKGFFLMKCVSGEDAADLRRIISTAKNLVEGLKNLKRPTISDDVLVYILANRLDAVRRRDWEKSLGTSRKPAAFSQLTEFLEGRILTLSTVASRNGKGQQSIGMHAHQASYRSKVPVCSLCSLHHQLWTCEAFKARNSMQRRESVLEKQLCENCLGSHEVSTCCSGRTCFVCGAKHHTSIHVSALTNSHVAVVSANSSVPIRCDEPLKVLVSETTSFAPTLLPTAWVSLVGADGQEHCVRALIDQGSQCSFLSQRLANSLQLPRSPACVSTDGIGGVHPTAALGRSRITVKSRCAPYSLDVDVLLLGAVTSYRPRVHRPTDEWPYLRDLQLADRLDSPSSEPIELLLGAAVYAQIIRPGLRQPQRPDAPIAQQTAMGWILSGPIGQSKLLSTLSSNFARTSTHPNFIFS